MTLWSRWSSLLVVGQCAAIAVLRVEVQILCLSLSSGVRAPDVAGPPPQVCMKMLHPSSGMHADGTPVLRYARGCYTRPQVCTRMLHPSSGMHVDATPVLRYACGCYTRPQVCTRMLLVVLRYFCRCFEVKTFPRAQTRTLGPAKHALHADNLL